MKHFFFLFSVFAVTGICIAQADEDGLGIVAYFDFEQSYFDFCNVAVDSVDGIDYFMEMTYPDGSWNVDSYNGPGMLHVNYPIILFNEINTLSDSSKRVDEASFITDGSHVGEITEIGGYGGNNCLQYVTGPSDYRFDYFGAPGYTPNYMADIVLRGIDVKENHSYRIQYYIKMDQGDDLYVCSPTVETSLIRGVDNVDNALSMGVSYQTFAGVYPGAQSVEQGKWNRASCMSYYATDSIARKSLYQSNGYWWTDQWKTILWENRGQFTEDVQRMFANNEDLSLADGATWGWIDQPDKFSLRMSFEGPNTKYMVDDIMIIESMLGAADYCGPWIRLAPGYETNIVEVAMSNGTGVRAIPLEAFVVTATDTNGDVTRFSTEAPDMKIVNAEIHADGYIYIKVDGDLDVFNSVRVSFSNSVLPDDCKLRYTGVTYPMYNDSEWVNTERFLPDISDEIVLSYPFDAQTEEQYPPMLVCTEPESESFFLNADNFKTVTVCFSKPVYTGDDGGVCLYATDSFYQLPFKEYADDTKMNLVFNVPSEVSECLSDRVMFSVENLIALDEETGGRVEGAVYALTQYFYLSFGVQDLNNLSGLASSYYYSMSDALGSLENLLDICKENLKIFGGFPYENAVRTADKFSIDNYFNGSHTAPSDFDSAIDSICYATQILNDRMDLTLKMKTLMDNSCYVLSNYSSCADYQCYKDLESAMIEYAATDFSVAPDDVLRHLYDNLFSIFEDALYPLMTVDVKTRQLKSLSVLNGVLGVSLRESLTDSVNACTEDDPILTGELKSSAYQAIEELRRNGTRDVWIDMTGFIDNYSLYSTGELDNGIVREYYQYYNTWRYRIEYGYDMDSIIPGWKISNSAGSVMCGFNLEDGFLDYEFGGFVQPGQAIEAAVCADWGSDFKISQTVTGLPNGTYTLSVSYGAGVDDANSHYIEANGLRQAAGFSENKFFGENTVLEGIQVTDGTLSITAYHSANNSWARLDDFRLTLTSLDVHYDCILGDANMDGKVNVSDFTTVANYIIDSLSCYSFSFVAADVNNSSSITVADLTGIANIILYDNPSGPVRYALPMGGAGDAITLSVSPFAVWDVSETSVDVRIANGSSRFSAYQFDVCLPEGVYVADVKLNGMRVPASSEHVFMCSKRDDCTVRVLFASVTGANVEGCDGAVVTLVLSSDGSLAEGEYEMRIDNIELSRDAMSICLQPSDIPFAVGNPTGIEGMGYGYDDDIYSVDGMKLDKPQQGINIIGGNKVLK